MSRQAKKGETRWKKVFRGFWKGKKIGGVMDGLKEEPKKRRISLSVDLNREMLVRSKRKSRLQLNLKIVTNRNHPSKSKAVALQICPRARKEALRWVFSSTTEP